MRLMQESRPDSKGRGQQGKVNYQSTTEAGTPGEGGRQCLR